MAQHRVPVDAYQLRGLLAGAVAEADTARGVVGLWQPGGAGFGQHVLVGVENGDVVATLGQHPGLHAGAASDIEHTLRRCYGKVFHQRSVHKPVAYSAAECAAAAGIPVGKRLTVVGGRGPGVHHTLFEVRDWKGAYTAGRRVALGDPGTRTRSHLPSMASSATGCTCLPGSRTARAGPARASRGTSRGSLRCTRRRLRHWPARFTVWSGNRGSIHARWGSLSYA